MAKILIFSGMVELPLAIPGSYVPNHPNEHKELFPGFGSVDPEGGEGSGNLCRTQTPCHPMMMQQSQKHMLYRLKATEDREKDEVRKETVETVSGFRPLMLPGRDKINIEWGPGTPGL